jgi:hypothetical protein
MTVEDWKLTVNDRTITGWPAVLAILATWLLPAIAVALILTL